MNLLPLLRLPYNEHARFTGLTRLGAYFALIILFSFTGEYASAADQAFSPTEETRTSVYAQQEEQLQATLRDNPNDRSALEKTALLAIERGRFREADRIYTRLLELLLPDPAAALPVMVCKWHLLQDYEAQADVIRAENENKLTQGNQRLAADWLSEIYNPQSVIAAIRSQMLDPEYAPLLDNLEHRWLEATARCIELETGGTMEELRDHANSVFGDSPAQSFFALWRGFALIRQKNLDKAEAALNLSALALTDSRTRLDVAAGSNLIREMRRRPLSNELLNNLSSLISDVSSDIGGQLGSLEERFDSAQKLIDEREFDAAADLLDALYPEVANDAARRIRYVFLHALALWGRQEFARANQGFTASAVLLREQYSISVAFQRMAEYAAMRDNPEQAAVYAVRSAALLRDQHWKLRETGDFFMSLNLPERAIAYFERSLDVSDTMAGDADAFASLAEAYKRIGERERYLEYAKEYVDTIRQVDELGDEITTHQDGMRHYYQAEILLDEKKLDDAYREYETASTIITEPYRLSDILMAMANLKARAGETVQAEELGIRVARLLPDQDWRLRDVGNLFLNLNEPAKALPYFEKALEHGHTLQGMAASYSSLADVHNRLQDTERAQHFARNYINLVKAHQDKLSNAERGLAAFYQGEIYNHQGDPRRGYIEYERAVRLLDDRYRRSDALLRMAEYQAAHGAREQATALAEASEAEVPGEWWKLRQIGEFFLRLNMPDKALEYFKEAAGLDPDAGMAATYAMMADAYKSMGNPERYSRYMQEYIKAVREDGRTPSPAEEGLAAYYDGEIKRLDGKTNHAFQSYKRASELLENKARLADALMQMADYEAGHGERESAADYARRSAEAEPTTDRLRRVGEFLLRQDMPEQALEYFERYARQVSSADGIIDVYSIVAENYKRMGDARRYLAFAKRYADTVAEAEEKNETISPANKGLAAFYRGEIAASEGERELACEEYEKASQLVTEPFRLSETLMRMAENKAALGDDDAAAALAARSADALPDEGWKMQQVANFLLDLNRPQEADKYIRRYADLSGEAKTQAATYMSWAESFKRAGNEERYLYFAKQFADLLKTGKVAPTPAERGLAAYYEGEVAAAGGDADAAYAAYEKAAGLIDDKDRLYEVYAKMAEYQAERGSVAKAAELVERAVDGLPLRDSRYRRAAEFVTRIGLPDAAKPYLEAYAGYSAESSNTLAANAAMAELYKERGDTREYLRYAGEYVIAASGDALALSPNDAGLAEFYRGEILASEGNGKDALDAYQKAVISLTDRNRLVETMEKMAAIEGELGNRERAAELLERAAGLLPDEEWNPWKAAELYSKLNMPEKALALYKQQLDLAQTPRAKAGVYQALAGIYDQLGDADGFADAAEKHIELLASPSFKPTRDENGWRAFYQARLFSRQQEPDKAFAAFEKAAELFTDKYQQSECYVQMAEIEAGRGNAKEAARLMEKAMATVPDNDWRARQTADMYGRLDMMPEAIDRYQRILARAKTPKAKAAVYRSLAEAYKRTRELDKFAGMAEQYVALTGTPDFAATPDEKAWNAFYRGELSAQHKDYEQALAAYEESAGLFTDSYQKSEAYYRMADVEAERGNNERAAELMEKSIFLVPDNSWRMQQAIDMFARLDKRDAAYRILEERLAKADTPKEKAAAYADAAELHRRFSDSDGFLRFAGQYVDLIADNSFKPTREEIGRAHAYMADIHLADDDPDRALSSLEKAVGFYDDKSKQAELYIRMAGLQADLGHNDRAALLAEKAVSLQPDFPARIMDAASIFNRVNMREKALEYYNRRLALAKTPGEKAEAFSALADFYAGPEREKYVQYAKDYIAAVSTPGYTASNDELGRMYYYYAEMYRLDDMAEEAIASYDTAAGLVTDTYFQSGIFIKIAELEVTRGNKAKAADLAARSLAPFPNDVWKSVEAARIYESAGQPEKAIETLLRLEGMESSAKSRWLLYANLADLYRKNGKNALYQKYVAQYIDSIAQKRNATASDRALGHFHLAELQKDAGCLESALELYQTALRLYDREPYRQSEIALKIAGIHAQRKEREKAIEYAEKSAEYTPDLPDRLRAAGDFLLGQKATNRAFRRYFGALRLSRTDRAKAAAYEAIAKAFKTLGDKERYYRYASEYYFAIDRLGDRATAFDRANQAFFLGEMHMLKENERQAYLAYERAAQLYTDPFMRTEALLPMARYNLKEKNKELAAEQAREVADLVPDQGWRVADAASILSGAGRNDQAIEALRRAIDYNPMSNASLYKDLSTAYVRNKEKKAGIKASENYIDFLYEKVEAEGPTDSTAMLQTLWNARENHANLLKPWGLGVESYQYLRRNEDGSYSISTSNELQKYYYLNRRLRGKMYLHFSDTLFALNKGTFDTGGGTGTWESYQRFGDSTVVGAGFSVEPFFEGVLKYLSINFEHLRGVGKNNGYKEWRIRPVFDMAIGDEIRPFGTRWHYTKLYSALVYSVNNEDVISYGNLKKGYTFATGKERNLLIMPYGTVTYRYGGKNMPKGERWGSEIGLGISFKQYFRTGRYHLPRANIEFDFHYRAGLTKGMMNMVGLTIASNF